ncbi:MAG: NADH:flavin oxidoreductase/NADH oxidase [Hyphomicrobiaceae bacterium]
MSLPLLFTPLEIREARLKNRIVIAPMHQYSAKKGHVTDWHLVNAGRYAVGGAAVVMMESTKVARNGCGTVGDTALWDDSFIDGMARCASFIKSNNALAAIQLGHSGRKARLTRPWEGGRPLQGDEAEIWDWDGWELVAPSAVAHSELAAMPRALSHNEIGEMVASWGRAAERAEKAGFDILEIHGAHGYLVHQFLSPASNIRTDEYGGTEHNRMRFALEVAECIRAAWPASKPLFMRLSCEDDAGFGPEQAVNLSRELKLRGVDVIDCSSGGTLTSSPMNAKRANTYGYQVPYADQIRREAEMMTMAVGHIVHADQAEAILQEGKADLVALAREVMYNPNWPMDAAQKLGVDPEFELVPPPYQYWLAKRAKSSFDGVPSTWRPGEARVGEI